MVHKVGGVSQLSGVPADLAEYWRSVPHTHVRQLTMTASTAPQNPVPFSGFSKYLCTVCIHKNARTQIKNNLAKEAI